MTAFIDFRRGGYLLALALALAAVLRAMLPDRYCLGLLVRSRRIDVVTAATMAAGAVRDGVRRPELSGASRGVAVWAHRPVRALREPRRLADRHHL